MADDDIDQEALKEAAEALREATADDAVSAGAGAKQPGDADDVQQASSQENAAAEAEGGGEASLEEQVAQLQSDLDQARDSAIRAQADAQNAQRRAEQDVEKARKFALERFCGELLPVVDNLERALETVDRDDAALKPIGDGVELTLKSFVEALRKFQIEQVDPEGEPFDPQLHQAMSMVENPDVEPNTVLSVMQKGYTLNGRLVRPAMVMVSKAPAA